MTNKKTNILLVLALTLGILTGCSRVQPVYNVDTHLAESKSTTTEKVGKVIYDAAVAEGWSVKKTGENMYRISTAWRQHAAVADVKYFPDGYTIGLVSSTNLLEKDGKIHRKYNERIQSLKFRIDYELAEAGLD